MTLITSNFNLILIRENVVDTLTPKLVTWNNKIQIQACVF